MSNDNKHLLMTVEREESIGLKDLFVSFVEDDGSWSKPLHMGNVVNSESEEANPFLAADGKTLYFSSKGHPGYGGYDLFVSKRLDDTWQNWSKPKNLGNVINSQNGISNQERVQKDIYGNFQTYSKYNEFVFGAPTNKAQQNMNFSLSNNIPQNFLSFLFLPE